MRLAVVGTGLIGGSFALAARRAGLFDRFIGVDSDPAAAQRAVALGLVDAAADAVPDDADAVLLATPSHTIAGWVGKLADHAGVVFDCGSVKGAVLDELRAGGAGVPERFVACHPLAGSEVSGPEGADAGLFRDAQVIVTPTAETSAAALKQVSAWWTAVGARVVTMEPRRHDEILAVTSHLPHLLAFTYLQQVDGEHARHGASGFRDFTRIGAASADTWAPIFQLNQRALLGALDTLEADLARVRGLLERLDSQGLHGLIEAAGRRRREFGRDD